jgi:hypothetical protein
VLEEITDANRASKMVAEAGKELGVAVSKGPSLAIRARETAPSWRRSRWMTAPIMSR